MQVLVFLFFVSIGIYLGIGLVTCLIVDFEDLKKRRISTISALGDMADQGGWAFVIYLLLWPVWYFAYKKADEANRQPTLFSY